MKRIYTEEQKLANKIRKKQHYQDNKDTRRVASNGYYSENKDKRKQYYQDNKEIIKKNVGVYQKDNIAKISKYHKEYWVSYYLENKENIRLRNQMWRKTNRLRLNAVEALRRSTKLNATPKWLTKDHLKEIEQFYIDCPKGHEVDHIVPLQGKTVCGLHVPWNLQILTASANRSKTNKLEV